MFRRMKEIFKIKVYNELLVIRASNTTLKNIQYEVWKNGKIVFTLEHQINKAGKGCWCLVDASKDSGINQDFVDSVGDKIDAYYE